MQPRWPGIYSFNDTITCILENYFKLWYFSFVAMQITSMNVQKRFISVRLFKCPGNFSSDNHYGCQIVFVDMSRLSAGNCVVNDL